MDNIQCDPEGSESAYDFEELIKGITRDSVRERMAYTLRFKRNDITLRLYVRDEDGISFPS